MVEAMAGKIELNQRVTANWRRTDENRTMGLNLTELGLAGGRGKGGAVEYGRSISLCSYPKSEMLFKLNSVCKRY